MQNDTESRLVRVLERIERLLESKLPETGGKTAAAQILGISTKTLERRLPELIKGSHYWREGKRLVFDLQLIRDWQRNKDNPAAHQRAIEARRKELLSQQKASKKA